MSATNEQTSMLADTDKDPSLIFPDLPPFPTNLPTAPLLRITLSALIAGDAAAETALWDACCKLGFFYLDLRGPSPSSPGPTLLSHATSLFALAPPLFSLPLAEKQLHDRSAQGSYHGYKGLGQGVIDQAGTRDRNEFWNVAKDEVLGLPGCDGEAGGTRGGCGGPPLPEVLDAEDAQAAIRGFVEVAHAAVVRAVLRCVNARMGLPEGRLEGMHRLREPSGDQVRWVRAPPVPVEERDPRAAAAAKNTATLGAHTDFGSVTVLFNRLGGLQVLLPSEEQGGEEEWAYVKPLKGHCVVILGDAMVKLSAGVLRSNVSRFNITMQPHFRVEEGTDKFQIHRVVGPPGQQANETRYSLVYFSRPEDHILLKPLDECELIQAKLKENPKLADEEVFTAKDWILRRALGRRIGGNFAASAGTEAEHVEKRDSRVEG